MVIPPGWAGCTRIYMEIVQSAYPGRGKRKNGSSCAEFYGKTGKHGTFGGRDVKIFFI